MPSVYRQRRGLLNLGLLVVVVLLALIAWQVSRPRKPDGHALIPGFMPSKVERISITRHNKPSLVLVPHQNGWRIEQPLSARANQPLVQALLVLPKQHTVHRYPIKGLRLSEYGLEPPEVTIGYGDGHKIRLGMINPVNHLQYALARKHVFLIRNSLANLANSGALNWVSLALLPPHSQIKILNLPGLTIQNKSPSRWMISPRPTHFEVSKVKSLLQNWTSLSAYRVTTASRITKPSALNRGFQRQLSITLANGKIYRFAIISTHPELVLRNLNSDIDYHLPGSMAHDILTLG